MKPFKNILVATDTRLEKHPIVDEAILLARRSGGSLMLVDVVPAFSWAVRMTLPSHNEIRDLMVREKQEQLETLAEPIRKQGVHVETQVLIGRSSVEIIRQVLRGNHDLVLRVAKGKDSQRKGFFGTTGVRLLRECPCAVWLVAPAQSHHYKHVMACIDTLSEEPIDHELNDKVYESALLASQYHGSRFSVVQAWRVFGEEFLLPRTRQEDFLRLMNEVQERFTKLFNAFLQKHGTSAQAKNVHMLKGHTDNILPAFIVEQGVDLVVMGTVARRGAAGWVIGNTAEQMLDRIECSLLALKTDSFECPIKQVS